MKSVNAFAMITPSAIIEHRTSGYIITPPSAKSVSSRYWVTRRWLLHPGFRTTAGHTATVEN